MTNKKDEYLNRIEFRYTPGIGKSESRETAFRIHANQLLSPLVDEINKQNGLIVGTVLATENMLSIEGVSDDLGKRVLAHLRNWPKL